MVTAPVSEFQLTMANHESLPAVLDGDACDFKVSTQQKLVAPDENPRWVAFVEIRSIYRVEAVEQRQIGAEDLDFDEIVHGHTCGFDGPLQVIQGELGLVGGRGWDFAR